MSRPNAYRVMFSVPAPVLEKLGDSIDYSSHISVMAQTVSHTGFTVNTQSAESLHTSSRKMPFARHTNGDLEISFLCTSGLIEQTIIETWQKVVVGSDYRVEYFDSITSDITIDHLRADGSVGKTTTYTEAFPSTAGTIETDKGAADSTLSLTTTWSFTSKVTKNDVEASTSSAANIRFGQNARKLPQAKSPTLYTAVPGNILLSDETKAVGRRIDAIRSDMSANQMNPQMALYMLNSIAGEIGISEISPNTKIVVLNYINKLIRETGK